MIFKDELEKRVHILNNFSEEDFRTMDTFVELIVNAIESGNKVMTCGNGGSAANAQHITGDIVGRYKIERKAFAGLSLTVDPSVMTATGNDYGYDEVFSRQVQGLGNSGDVLIVLSSSANSPNLLRAAETAKEMGVTVIGVLGNKGGELKKKTDYSLLLDFKDSDLVEETAMVVFHIVLLEVEKKLVKKIGGK
ncbi:SIS domain-containing protein [Alkalibacterium sp. 20]|uniref:D-sedoheptulose-7-phosphate isomerase n=1 Tax=Alkalibacterium sp. 20 TaxID=1798803 RepID=UPI0009003823|nr:SIS domain-containing protein [Alkalibacterium sp. 20]OJF94695.1 sugar isomerase [Alkalibacterium sp. 20]